MSAQQLSDACAALGVEIPRTVLSNLENGRRGNVTVAELLALGAALAVPPAALVYPVGYETEVEILPGVTVDAKEAVDWVSGHASPLGQAGEEDSAVHRYRRHQALVTEAIVTIAEWNAAQAHGDRQNLLKVQLKSREAVLQAELEAMHRQAAELSREAEGVRGDTTEGLEVMRRLADNGSRSLAISDELRRLAEEKRTVESGDYYARVTEERVRELIAKISEDSADIERHGWNKPSHPQKIRDLMT